MCHSQERILKVDVFFCTRLHSVEKHRKRWIERHLSGWKSVGREILAIIYVKVIEHVES